MLIPSLAVGARRLRDTDRTGWWLLLGLVPVVGPIVLIVFFCLEGTPGANRYGTDPKLDAVAGVDPRAPHHPQAPGHQGQPGNPTPQP